MTRCIAWASSSNFRLARLPSSALAAVCCVNLLNLEQPGRNLYDAPGLFLGGGIHIRHHLTNLSGIFGDGANGGNDIVQFSRTSSREGLKSD
jgi:hypothetical protein